MKNINYTKEEMISDPLKAEKADRSMNAYKKALIAVNLDFTKIDNVEINGVDTMDYPDFCDAFITSCDYNGREATEEELEIINMDSEFVHEKVYEQLY